MRTTIQSEITWVPPVTAERSPPEFADHWRRFACNRGFVYRGDALDDFAIGGDQVARLDINNVAEFELKRGYELIILVFRSVRELLCHHIGFRGAQACGLRFAAPFGHSLGEIRKQDREPEPQIDLERKGVVACACENVADEEGRGEHRHNFDHEHHGVFCKSSRIELLEG